MKIGEVYGNSNNKLLKSISSSEKTLFIELKNQDKMEMATSFNEMVELEASIKYSKIISACQNHV